MKYTHKYKAKTPQTFKSHYSQIYEAFKREFIDECSTILNQPENNFLTYFNLKMDYIIQLDFDKETINEPKFQHDLADIRQNLYENIYKTMVDLCQSSYLSFIHTKPRLKEQLYLKGNFRNHCSNNDLPVHTCGGRFIIAYDPNEEDDKKVPLYVICSQCKMAYYESSILMMCKVCKKEFYSSLTEESERYPPATWEKYHCNVMYNAQMECIKCKAGFVIKNNMLHCPSCKFTIDPKSLSYKCVICHKDFTSKIKPYNPMEFKIVKLAIRNALLFKRVCKPRTLPCGCYKDLTNINFYHKIDCDGILYHEFANEKDTLVCNKCDMFCSANKFNWHCPKCKKSFFTKDIKIYKSDFDNDLENLLNKKTNSKNQKYNNKNYQSNYRDDYFLSKNTNGNKLNFFSNKLVGMNQSIKTNLNDYKKNIYKNIFDGGNGGKGYITNGNINLNDRSKEEGSNYVSTNIRIEKGGFVGSKKAQLYNSALFVPNVNINININNEGNSRSSINNNNNGNNGNDNCNNGEFNDNKRNFCINIKEKESNLAGSIACNNTNNDTSVHSSINNDNQNENDTDKDSPSKNPVNNICGVYYNRTNITSNIRAKNSNNKILDSVPNFSSTQKLSNKDKEIKSTKKLNYSEIKDNCQINNEENDAEEINELDNIEIKDNYNTLLNEKDSSSKEENRNTIKYDKDEGESNNNNNNNKVNLIIKKQSNKILKDHNLDINSNIINTDSIDNNSNSNQNSYKTKYKNPNISQMKITITKIDNSNLPNLTTDNDSDQNPKQLIVNNTMNNEKNPSILNHLNMINSTIRDSSCSNNNVTNTQRYTTTDENSHKSINNIISTLNSCKISTNINLKNKIIRDHLNTNTNTNTDKEKSSSLNSKLNKTTSSQLSKKANDSRVERTSNNESISNNKDEEEYDNENNNSNNNNYEDENINVNSSNGVKDKIKEIHIKHQKNINLYNNNNNNNSTSNNTGNTGSGNSGYNYNVNNYISSNNNNNNLYYNNSQSNPQNTIGNASDNNNNNNNNNTLNTNESSSNCRNVKTKQSKNTTSMSHINSVNTLNSSAGIKTVSNEQKCKSMFPNANNPNIHNSNNDCNSNNYNASLFKNDENQKKTNYNFNKNRISLKELEKNKNLNVNVISYNQQSRKKIETSSIILQNNDNLNELNVDTIGKNSNNKSRYNEEDVNHKSYSKIPTNANGGKVNNRGNPSNPSNSNNDNETNGPSNTKNTSINTKSKRKPDNIDISSNFFKINNNVIVGNKNNISLNDLGGGLNNCARNASSGKYYSNLPSNRDLLGQNKLLNSNNFINKHNNTNANTNTSVTTTSCNNSKKDYIKMNSINHSTNSNLSLAKNNLIKTVVTATINLDDTPSTNQLSNVSQNSNQKLSVSKFKKNSQGTNNQANFSSSFVREYSTEKSSFKSSMINNLNSNSNNDNCNSNYNTNSQFNNNNSHQLERFNFNDYAVITQIGQGTFGKIYLVEDKNKNLFSMKKIIVSEELDLENIIKEYQICHRLQHKNIVQIIGFFTTKLDVTTYAIYILMEVGKCDWGKEIKQRIDQRKYYSENELLNILCQLTNALAFLQNQNVSHRDIKPQNVLVFKGNVYKIADFGEAKQISMMNKDREINTLRGTELYMSPLLYNGLRTNQLDIKHNLFKSDVYSLGLCILSSATLTNNSIYELRKMVDMKNVRVFLGKVLRTKYGTGFINLLGDMLEINEKFRPDFLELKKRLNKTG